MRARAAPTHGKQQRRSTSRTSSGGAPDTPLDVVSVDPRPRQGAAVTPGHRENPIQAHGSERTQSVTAQLGERDRDSNAADEPDPSLPGVLPSAAATARPERALRTDPGVASTATLQAFDEACSDRVAQPSLGTLNSTL